MKEALKKITMISLVYLTLMFGINLICGLILIKHHQGENYIEMVAQLMCGHFSFSESDMLYSNVVIFLKKIIESVVSAILASFIFSYIINGKTKIIFPEKIVLRRRTSEGSKGKLTVGILVGNPGKLQLLDVKCVVNCTYIKKTGQIEQRNSETFLSQTVNSVQNYFRFSFEIKRFPRKFWKHFIRKKEKYINKDFLIVSISGRTEGVGGDFRVTKRYGIQDIIVDFHEPEKIFKKKIRSFFSLKKKVKIDWKEFPKCIEASESQRQDVINEIKQYVNSKTI